MVKKCVVCHKYTDIAPNLSFHAFPTNPERRRDWCNALNIEPDTLKNSFNVCSDHFPPDSFTLLGKTLSNRRFPTILKRDANPVIVKEEISVEITESPTLETARVNVKQEEESPQPSVESPVRNSPSLQLSCTTLEPVERTFTTPRQNDTLISTDPDEVGAFISERSCETSYREKYYRYFGDFTSPDMACPRKALKCFRLAKSRIDSLTKKNKTLGKANARLASKVARLKEVIRELKNNPSATDSASGVLEVSNCSLLTW